MSEKNTSSNKTENGSKTASPAANSAGLKKLFGDYDAADKRVRDLEKQLETAKEARGSAVAAICTAAGGRKGPFRHPTSGLVVSAVERTNKETGEKTWFFKGPSAHDVIEV